jgi:hypothetical protein
MRKMLRHAASRPARQTPSTAKLRKAGDHGSVNFPLLWAKGAYSTPEIHYTHAKPCPARTRFRSGQHKNPLES